MDYSRMPQSATDRRPDSTSVRVPGPSTTGIWFVLLLLWPATSLSGGEAADPSLLTIDRIFNTGEFATEYDGSPRWLKDGSGYTTLEASKTCENARDVVRYRPESGRRTVMVLASRLVPSGQSAPLRVEDYAWSDDARKLLIFTNSTRVWRENTRGDYWVFNRDNQQLQKLGGNAAPSTLMFATFSPDGRRVAYVRENNLYVQDLADLRVTQLTKDGSQTIVNGTSDWVYEEEFHLRKAFRWSPDGRYIAYWQFDDSGVSDFHLVNNTDALYPRITSVKYPKAGETNAACRLGVVPSGGGATRWWKTSDDPRNHYLPRMEWAPNSQWVAIQQLNRLQNTNQVVRGDAQTGDAKVLFKDQDDAWVDVHDPWLWIERGKRFLWLSERDGWRHLYAVSRSGKKVSLLTPGEYDVIAVAGVDRKLRSVYILASPHCATQKYLYRVPLDGSGRLVRVTPEDQPGTHDYGMSKGCRWAFHTYSRFGQPPLIELVRLPDHKRVRLLGDNLELRARLGRLKACATEFFRVDIGGGVQLDAWCIKPPDFQPSRRYPAVFYVYGEPAGQTVVDSWGGRLYLWHTMLAQQGYLVMSIDNRGTRAPRGRDWRKCIYRQVGILAPADQAAAAREILKARPYADPERIGIWGWSGGGSMALHAIFRYPDLYRAAMAVASVPDQRLYDTIYQERYMGLPSDNQAGYAKGSPITFAHQLKGKLLLVHGTGDDNCHYQGCERLINELVKHNRPFSMIAYPNRTHAIREGENTSRHLFESLTRYLRENLPPGPDH